jgi:hypothetical protein
VGANVTVKVDLQGLEKKCSPEAVKRGKVAMIGQMITDMQPFIPRRDGTLSASGSAFSDGIRYPGPYARAQFYGSSYNKNRSFTFSKYTTPGTGKRWDKKAIPKHGKNWGKVALRAMGVN